MKDDEKKFLIAVYNKGNKRVRDCIAESDIHHKRCWYYILKWAHKDWYNYGTTLDLGWLSPKGIEKAIELRGGS